jgi:hypothetical protein
MRKTFDPKYSASTVERPLRIDAGGANSRSAKLVPGVRLELFSNVDL